MKRQSSLILFATRGSILNPNHRVTQDPEQAEPTRRPALWLLWKQSSFHWNTSQLRDPTYSTSLNAAPPGRPAPSQGSKTDTEKGVGLQEPGGGKKKQGPVQEETKNTRGKKIEKPKKVQGNFFASLYFWPSGGKYAQEKETEAVRGQS